MVLRKSFTKRLVLLICLNQTACSPSSSSDKPVETKNLQEKGSDLPTKISLPMSAGGDQNPQTSNSMTSDKNIRLLSAEKTIFLEPQREQVRVYKRPRSKESPAQKQVQSQSVYNDHPVEPTSDLENIAERSDLYAFLSLIVDKLYDLPFAEVSKIEGTGYIEDGFLKTKMAQKIRLGFGYRLSEKWSIEAAIAAWVPFPTLGNSFVETSQNIETPVKKSYLWEFDFLTKYYLSDHSKPAFYLGLGGRFFQLFKRLDSQFQPYFMGGIGTSIVAGYDFYKNGNLECGLYTEYNRVMVLGSLTTLWDSGLQTAAQSRVFSFTGHQLSAGLQIKF